MSAEQKHLSALESTDVADTIVEQIDITNVEATTHEVISMIAIMQKHLEKEAKNREVPMLEPVDLCPAQKKDLAREMARLFRGV